MKKGNVISIIFITLIFWSTLKFAEAQGKISRETNAWYVSGEGNDANDGKTTATAFRTLQKAAEAVQPGQTVWISNGIYSSTNVAEHSTVLNIEKSGGPDAWITWKAKPGHHPELRPVGWNGIHISGSYHIIDGLTVTGRNDSIALVDALADAKKTQPDPKFNTNGIFVNGRQRNENEKPHHVIIRNCTVSKCPGGGIVMIETDYVTVEDCKVFENAWYMRYAGSGITYLNNWAFDDEPGYHFIIQRNYVWNNKTMVPWEKTGKLSDGNGIILDVTDQETTGATNPNADAVVTTPNANNAASLPAKPKRPEWKGRSLVANNLSAFNGGSGIHTFRTKHVDVINNTTYWNGSVVNYEELFANRSEDIVIMNNIIVPRPGGRITSNNRSTNIRWDYNLYPIAQEIFKAPHDIVADPKFINVQRDILEGDFRVKPGSQARDNGTNELMQVKTISGSKRPLKKGIDRGAFEQ